VGSFEEVAHVLNGFRDRGISQLLLRDWPGTEDRLSCAAELIPMVRALEGGSTSN
jgi:hypothetical protein